ncbi:MAG: S41 family peptidase [Bacteroidota bacterium]
MLESHHPGLYWYQGKENWDRNVQNTRQQLNESLTEPEFRKKLRLLVAGVRCGHTSIQSSRVSNRSADTAALRNLFPLSLKCWKDTMMVFGNLDTKDSVLIRGVQILSINGRSAKEIIDTLSRYISGDGFNRTHPDQTLSGWGNFGNYYRMCLDTSSRLSIQYVDRAGQERSVVRGLFTPKKDSVGRKPAHALSKKEKKNQSLERIRSLQIDTANRQALLRINSFGEGGRLRRFFRQGFRLINDNRVEDLIIDVRNNGGGRVGNSTNLTKYISKTPFRVADSLYAIRRHSRYSKHIQQYWASRISMHFLTKKRKDGLYHFGYFERHLFAPRSNDHYNGRTFILTSGYSFSATTLFINAVRGQSGVTIVGDETGGGAYGNSAWEIPTAILPNTKIRLRIPLFRMVMDKRLPNNGRGIIPDVGVGATPESIRMNYDNKMRVTQSLIQAARRKGS